MKKYIPLLIGALMLTLISCGSEDDAAGGYQRITAEEAYKMMEKGGVTVVDVRRPDEYASGHIKDAVLVTNETIGSAMPEELPDRDATLLIYCRSGRRSREASNKLLDLGYKNVYDFGGINSWPYEIVK